MKNNCIIFLAFNEYLLYISRNLRFIIYLNLYLNGDLNKMPPRQTKDIITQMKNKF